MKIRLLRIVRDKVTKEEIQVPSEVDTEEVQCVYKDRNGVSLSLKNGYTVKVAHTLEEMVDCFINNSSDYDSEQWKE